MSNNTMTTQEKIDYLREQITELKDSAAECRWREFSLCEQRAKLQIEAFELLLGNLEKDLEEDMINEDLNMYYERIEKQDEDMYYEMLKKKDK